MPPIIAANKLTPHLEAGSRSPQLEPSTQRFLDLFSRVREGALQRRAALDILIRENDKLVRSIARRYENRGLNLTDLVHEGNIGLFKAIGSFELRLKESDFENLVSSGRLNVVDFSTPFIRTAIESAIQEKWREISNPNRFTSLDNTISFHDGKKKTLHNFTADPAAYNPEERALARLTLARLSSDYQEALREELPANLPSAEEAPSPPPVPNNETAPVHRPPEASPRQKELAKELLAVMDRPGLFEQRFSALAELLSRKEISTSDVFLILNLLDRSNQGRQLEVKGKIIELLSRLPKGRLLGAKIQAEKLASRNETVRRWLAMFYVPIRAMIAFFCDGGPRPLSFFSTISQAGTHELLTIDQSRLILTGLGVSNEARLARFSFERNEDKTYVLATELDGTAINRFEIIRRGNGIWEAVPEKLTRMQKSLELHDKILAFLEDAGPPPDPFIKKAVGGCLRLLTVNGQEVNLTPLGCEERMVRISLRTENGRKIAAVSELDGELIREFSIEKGPDSSWQAVPFVKSEMQLSVERGRAIRAFILTGKEPGQEYTMTIKEHGAIDLVEINGNPLQIGALGNGERPAKVRFQLINEERICTVSELDGRLIKQYKFIQSDSGLWQAVPLNPSTRQSANDRSQLIISFFEGGPPPAENYTFTIRENGSIDLITIGKKHLSLDSLVCRERKALVAFRVENNQPIVSVYEENRGENDKPIREYRIIKRRNRWLAVPLEKSARKLAMERTQMILEFIAGKRQRAPKPFPITIGRGGTAFLFSVNRKSVIISSLGCERRQKTIALATIEKFEQDKVIVTVTKRNGVEKTYILASHGVINFKPPLIFS
jgi:RNA polymerase sigma factor (sigma-70 family)